MALTKYRLDSLLRESDERNHEGCYEIEDVKGISIQKVFIETKANMDGVSLKPYKLVNPDSFAYVTVTSRNGEKITIAHNDGDDVYIVSSSYVVFEVARPDILDSRYLFMYFNRPEFDRYARFNSWGSARETFSWKDMCDIEIDLPDIDTQRKYVAIYSAMLENQRCYEQGLDDLKLACDAYIEQLMRDYPSSQIGNYLSDSDVRNKENLTLDFVRGISTEKLFIPTKANMDGVSLGNYKIVQPGEFSYVADTSRRGDKISLALNESDKPYLVSSISIVFKTNKAFLNPYYLMLFFSRSEFDRYARFNSWGSARETFNWEDMCEVCIPIPPIEIQESIAGVFKSYRTRFDINKRLKTQLKDLCPILIKGSVEDASE